MSYAYVCSAAKVFEKRECTRELQKLPDFEQVYHLVVDAVDQYNEMWELEYIRSTQPPEASEAGTDTAAAVLSASGEEGAATTTSAADAAGTTKAKRLNFMSAVSLTTRLHVC